jgi:RNA polymerase sigma factor (TIGR02999 family)
MLASDDTDITRLLHELSQGRSDALDRLVPVVYGELRRLAHVQLHGERPGHTLSTTAVVHETYLRLVQLRQVDWKGRAHFFAMAARLMRRVLIDHARSRKRSKRGGRAIHVPITEGLHIPVEQADGLLALEDALARLEARNPRQCRVVECRCFAGLSVEETAAALGASEATVKRDWAFARAWLNRELNDTGEAPADGD